MRVGAEVGRKLHHAASAAAATAFGVFETLNASAPTALRRAHNRVLLYTSN